VYTLDLVVISCARVIYVGLLSLITVGFPVITLLKYERYYGRFEVFTAVNMKNVVFWDIKPQFVLHRRHIKSPLQSPAS
jgi:hypothetical protein